LVWIVTGTTLCDKVCQWLATGQWFSPDPPVSSTNKTDRHDIAEILLIIYYYAHYTYMSLELSMQGNYTNLWNFMKKK
jgi:hypothetical protein